MQQAAEDINTGEAVCIICKKNGTELPGLKPLQPQQWTTLKSAADKRQSLSSDKFHQETLYIQSIQYSDSFHYHSLCSSSFCAVKRKSEPASSSSASTPPKATRSTSDIPKSDSKGVLSDRSCIFCPIRYKRNNKGGYEKLNQVLVTEKSEKIVSAAKLFPVLPMSQRVLALGSEDLVAIEAKYHTSCEKKFTRETATSSTSSEVPVKTNRQRHDAAFASLVTFIETEILANKIPKYATQLHDLYMEEYKALSKNTGDSDTDVESYAVQPLITKIQNKFKDQIFVDKESKKGGSFVFSSTLSLAEAKAALKESNLRTEEVRSVAMTVRTEILQMPRTKMPTPTSIHTLKESAPELPPLTKLFFQTMMSGLSVDQSDATERKVTAMSSDAVFNTTRGMVRPWKNTALGLGLSSLLGSKNAIKVLNRHGHVVSYDESKRIETEIAYSCSEEGRELPAGLHPKPMLATGTAWDNYDLQVETLDGKMTLHVTVGITFQNWNADVHMTADEGTSEPIGGRPRRKYDGPVKVIPPFYTNLKSAKFSFGATDLDVPLTGDFIRAKELDFLWIVKLVDDKIPLFNGFYSQFVLDPLPATNITYMDPISQSPTRNDVVHETMVRSLQIADETKQSYYPVTYDLAIALKAYSIQALRTPQFDKLIILLGHFHIDLAFFGALGSFTSESGLEYILTESQILAEGSLNGFTKGKFYNRCTRVHQLTAAVMEKLLFLRYLTTEIEESHQPVVDEIRTISKDDIDALNTAANSEPFLRIMRGYEDFFHRVIRGELGETAQMWAMYIYLMNRLYREIQRAVRTNDVELYASILPSVIEVFFALNRPNYARWGSLFTNRLSNLDSEALDILKAGAFTTKRTKKSYSRSPIDLTLEQTVNRDASSSATGITAFTNSTSAFRRWCVSLTQRSMAVTEMKDMSGIQPGETPANQLRKSRIERDNKDLRILQKMISETCDPFAVDAPKMLVNIATGKAARKETSKYLLGTLMRGMKQRQSFLKECAEDESRFLKRVERVKVHNFAAENIKRLTATDKRLNAAEGVRDAFGHLLTMATEQIDLQSVLMYPITEIPLSIAHPDGSPMKTDKATLTKNLEKQQTEVLDETKLVGVDGTVWDGGLVYHEVLPRHKNSTYGTIAIDLMIKVCNTKSSEVRLLLDEYLSPSIKDTERLHRGSDIDLTEFEISGSEQKQHRSGVDLLKNGSFKQAFSKFLMNDVKNENYAPIIREKVVYLSHGGKCIKLRNDSMGMLVVTEPPELQARHEEADTLIGYHCCRMNGQTNVRSSDTDVLIILLGLTKKLADNRSIIMDFGAGNNRRLINVTEIGKSLEEKQEGLSKAIVAFHALTGCDFTSSFYRKGKSKPLDYLESSQDHVQALLSMCSEEMNVHGVTSYICRIYGFRSTSDINEARYQAFLKITGSKDNSFGRKIKKINCASLPPCREVLRHHLMRAHYVTLLWSNVHESDPTMGRDPTEYGWMKNGLGYLVPCWYEGDCLPRSIQNVHSNPQTDDDTNDETEPKNDEAVWSGDSDSEDEDDGDF